jgi:hypothetical protein
MTKLPEITTPHDFSNWRVSYVAPTKPEHSFEPRCSIEADSAEFGSCRVFDVPDVDESQLAAAMAACKALNAYEELVKALQAVDQFYAFHGQGSVGAMATGPLSGEIRNQVKQALQKARE